MTAVSTVVGSALTMTMARTDTVCTVSMDAGAVYRPSTSVPGAVGLRNQATVSVLPVPVTANCWVWEAVTVTAAGVIENRAGDVSGPPAWDMESASTFGAPATGTNWIVTAEAAVIVNCRSMARLAP